MDGYLLRCTRCGQEYDSAEHDRLKFCQSCGTLLRPSMITNLYSRGDDLSENPDRSVKVIHLLRKLFYEQKSGIFLQTEMPESDPPEGVVRGSYEHILFLTMTVSIDYQRSAFQLWDAARRTFRDSETTWVFSPSDVAVRPLSELVNALVKYRLAKKPEKDASIWRKIGESFSRYFDSDPRNLFERYNYNAHDIYNNMRNTYRYLFPYLSGATGTSKILSLWLRMLHDEAHIPFNDLNLVPIPVDTHIARATFTIGCLYGRYHGPFKEIVPKIRAAWRRACEGTGYYSLQLDEPLWNLSRLGCTNRVPGYCQKSGECGIYQDGFCVIDGIVKVSQDAETVIETRIEHGQ